MNSTFDEVREISDLERGKKLRKKKRKKKT